ncbi:MAG: hypothetical protein WC824_12515, partial [Bacteroidota bacterium]
MISKTADILAMAADGTVYVGTGNGLYRSTDDGLNWQDITTNLPIRDIGDIAVLNDGTVLAATWGSGIFRSTNKGQSWTESNTGITQPRIYCLLVSFPGIIYAGSYGDGVFRSTDQGLSWTTMPLSGYIYDMGESPSGDIFAIKSDNGVYRSPDNGLSWIKSDQGIPYFRGYGFGFRSAMEIMFGVTVPQGMYRSLDGGATWSAFNDGYSLSSTRSLTQTSDGNWFAPTYGDGVYVLPQDSSRWQARNQGMQGSWIYAMASDPSGALFAGGFGGVRVSRDAGVSWSPTNKNIGIDYVLDLLYTNNTLLAAGNPGGVS